MAGTTTRRTLTKRIHVSLEDEGPGLAVEQAEALVLGQVRSGLFGPVDTYDAFGIESAVWEEKHQHWHLVVVLTATVLVDGFPEPPDEQTRETPERRDAVVKANVQRLSGRTGKREEKL